MSDQAPEERNPAAFVQFVMGDTEGLTPEQISQLEEMKADLEAEVLGIWKKVKAEPDVASEGADEAKT